MNKKKRQQNSTAKEKLKAVLDFKGKNEQERGLYLLSHDLYSVDIER